MKYLNKKQSKKKLFLIGAIFLVSVLSLGTILSRAEASTAAVVTSPFTYSFGVDGILNEAGSMNTSTSPYWWLNSGGQMILKGGLGSTIIGNLPVGSYWQVLYNAYDPVDTDNGIHPQNLFRMVTRSLWQNEDQQIDFKIVKYNLSNSPERYNPNGVLLFNRYIDGNNLYYAGVRVDGTAVIKKKIKGTYYTMAQTKVFPGTYNRTTNPNLIPINVWMKIRSRVANNADGTVTITLYTDSTNSGTWTKTLEVIDDNKTYGGASFRSLGYAGLRTDFMDLYFDNYKVSSF